MGRLSIGFAILLSFTAGCQKQAPVQSPADYQASIRAWQQHRDKGLRQPNGWLTLAGLFWLQQGDNSIGSAGTNEFPLGAGAPAHWGKLTLHGDTITFINESGAATTVDGKPVTKPVSLSTDEEKPDVVRNGSFSFLAMKRVDKYAVRVKNTESPVLKQFHGMDYFPTDSNLHFPQAKLIADVRKIPILNIVGQTEMQESPGVVEFEYKGSTYKLRPIYEGKTLFFLYRDPTNKTSTYQAGRMLNTPLPVNGLVDLDFNRSYNPPCTFTPYATCALPPKENSLTFPVEAGEKRYGNGHPEGYGGVMGS